MALIVGAGLLMSSLWGNVHKNVLGYATDMSISTLLSDTNTQRQSNSLAGLSLNEQLDQAAQAKANDMATRDYWSHNTPDGATPWTFIINAGYQYQTAGENLAYGFDTSDATVTAWMNSPEHRDNILNNTYTDVGFGVANAANYQGTGPETVVVAMYASPVPSTSVSIAPSPAPASAAPTHTTPAPTTSSTQGASASNPSPSATNPSTAVGSHGHGTPSVSTSISGKSKNVARVQLLSGSNAQWSMLALSTLAAICLVIFFLRHGLLLHRVLVRGEAFVLKHRYLDIALVLLIVAGFVLTRSAGVIH